MRRHKFYQQLVFCFTARKSLVIWLLCIVSLGLSACRPNHQYYSKQNVKLIAGSRKSVAYYTVVEIGTPKQPFYKNLQLYGDLAIELTDQVFVPLSELTVSMLTEASLKTSSLDDVGYDTGWPQGSQRVTVSCACHFVVHDVRILKVIFHSSVGMNAIDKPPRLRCHGSNNLYELPFSHEQVLELFGEPEKLNEIWHM